MIGAGTTKICQKCQRPGRLLQSEQLKAKKVLGVINRLIGSDIRHVFSCLFKTL